MPPPGAAPVPGLAGTQLCWLHAPLICTSGQFSRSPRSERLPSDVLPPSVNPEKLLGHMKPETTAPGLWAAMCFGHELIAARLLLSGPIDCDQLEHWLADATS